MKYCDNCGEELQEKQNYCPHCGKNISGKYNNQNNASSTTVAICGIVGILFPIIGAVLYHVLKNSDPKAAKTANECSWIGFILCVLLCVFIYFIRYDR